MLQSLVFGKSKGGERAACVLQSVLFVWKGLMSANAKQLNHYLYMYSKKENTTTLSKDNCTDNSDRRGSEEGKKRMGREDRRAGIKG